MKLINYFLLSTILAIILCTSCNKEEIETNKGNEFSEIVLPDSVNIQVDNNILVFESESSLQTCINYLSAIGDDNFDEFERALGYESFRSVNVDTSIVIEDDIFSTLMNPDRQIIVGGYLLTTNIKEETTSVAFVDNSGLKSAQEETTLDWDINVFDYLDTGNSASLKRSFCKNTDVKKQWSWGDDNMLGNKTYRIQAKVCFQRAGWYNSIIIKFKYEHDEGPNLMDYRYKLHYVTQDAWYRRRNRSTTHFSRENSCKAWEQGYEISHRPYNGTRRVSEAKVPVLFDYVQYVDDWDNVVERGSVLLTMKLKKGEEFLLLF